MESSEQEAAFILAAHVVNFATRHPYAATGILGAAAGSFATYKVMTNKAMREKIDGVFTPKVYQLELTREDLTRMLADPSVEIRIETTEMSVVVSSEKREMLKQLLPDIEIDEDFDIRR